MKGSPIRNQMVMWVLTMALHGFGDEPVKTGRANWRVVWANDAVFDSDDQFSNGFGVGWNSALVTAPEHMGGTPAFGATFAGWVLPKREDLNYREGWSLDHNIQNPNDIRESDLILDDVPYVSMLTWSSSHIAFHNREFTGFQSLVGWVGSYTFGEEIQKNGHKFFDANMPAGWENQLDNEPLFNLYYMKKHKRVDHTHYDVSLNIDAAVGNMFTFAQTALELRFGDRPDGFAYQINTMGNGLNYDARIHRNAKQYFYSSLILRGRALLHALPRDGNLLRSGNTWTEENTIETNFLIGQIGLSLHYEARDWGVQATLFFTSESGDSSLGNTFGADPHNNFAVITFERFF